MPTKYQPPPVPREALAYFRAKGYKLSWDYRDVWKQEHARAFTVAKAMNIDLLTDIRNSVDHALAEGQTLRDFKAGLEPLLAKRGWTGFEEMPDGSLIELGTPRRLKTIYDANLRTARAAGQWDRIQRTKKRLPYLIYLLGPSLEHRDEHSSWKDTVLPVDDPWWQTHYPPNGWGCKCHIRQTTKTDAKDRGISESPEIRTEGWENLRTGQVEQVPVGIDPGWDTNPGVEAAKFRALTPPPLDGLPKTFPGTATPPAPKPVKVLASDLLPDNLTEKQYVDHFIKRIGKNTFIDKTGTPLPINDRLFKLGDGSWKVGKGKRRVYMLLLADTIKEPDEIWMRWENRADGKGYVLKRRYLKAYELEDGQFGVGSFEWNPKDGWQGSTIFSPDNKQEKRREAYYERQRDGFLIYRKPEEG
jgi:hypothetical protein